MPGGGVPVPYTNPTYFQEIITVNQPCVVYWEWKTSTSYQTLQTLQRLSVNFAKLLLTQLWYLTSIHSTGKPVFNLWISYERL